ncbi:cytochrome P450 [Pleurocapsales cyanobacterium LEGE 06147]|nr:cytochrome P450 [Pleurocapsales cyanobacterium LEGE 06147]
MSQILSHTYSLLDPELAVDPYPIYKKLRAEAPIYWDEQSQAWLVSRYTDVKALIGDPRISSVPRPLEWESRRRLMEALADIMQFSDPPTHTHIRGLVESAYFPLFVKMRGRIQQLVNNLLDAVQESGRMDLISDLANPLPFTIITELIGYKVEDPKRFRKWFDSFARFAIVTSHSPTTEKEDRQILEDLLEMTDFFHAIVEQRRREPKDDLITALIQAEVNGKKLSTQGILTNAIQLTAGGYIPMTSLLGHALLALLRHPDQMQKLQADPKLLDSAIEESLRYDSFVQWVTRRANTDIELHGQLIRKDQIFQFGYGSANRDEAQFPNADRFDITRKDNNHLGFGFGPHTCVGALFTRLQMQIVVGTIMRRMRGMRLETNNIEFIGTPTFRIPTSLPVTFEPS